jgi:isoleucyl-tRNA synthetase
VTRPPAFRQPSMPPDFPALEHAVLEFWRAERIFERSTKGRADAPELVFYEGPPTANGKPGLHHVWARVYKDLFCRFWTMRGYRVPRRAGWDTHGLSVEVQVERELGFSGKDQIEAFGVAAFVERCRQSVLEYVEDWKLLTERIGYFVDLDNAYWTMSPGYIQSVWWHLARLYDRGLLFEDLKVVPYCVRCGTALSSHELGQPEVYREVTDVSAYVRFPLTGAPLIGSSDATADALVVWTTTPWTLPSNVAVAVGEDIDYVVVDGMVVAAERAEAVFGAGALQRVSGRMRGRDLVGLSYRRPLAAVPVPPASALTAWTVLPATFVVSDEGTGLVHIAPAFGADDWALGRQFSLPVLNPVGPDGRFTDSAGWLAGTTVRLADAAIVQRLAADGLLVRAEDFTHQYPHCWRCATPLIYWGKPSWYVATSSHKPDLIAANETVSWRPEHVKHGRFGEWLANNVDWALSRDRYWGTPLPIWRCPVGHQRCVASLDELSELSGSDQSALDPHRPGIDEVTLPCPECGAESRRVEAVIDAWFDSGSMPAAQWGYPADPGSADRVVIPAEFVAEAIDQTRGWFYSLLAVNVLVHGTTPYRHVLALGHMVDADGRKMSKSLGNVIDPWTVLDSRGADPLRWWMFHQGSPWTSTRTSLAMIDLSTADVLLTLWNSWSFFATYAGLNAFDPSDERVPAASERSGLDRWILSRLAGTAESVTAFMEDYRPLEAATAIGSLIDDISNWYVRRSRRRFWRTDPATSVTEVLAAHATLLEVLLSVARLLAPFCPFVAEDLWRSLGGTLSCAGMAGTAAVDVAAADGARTAGDAAAESRPDSVHLTSWPALDATLVDSGLEASVELTRQVVSLGRAARAKVGQRVRQPLRRAVVVVPPRSPELLYGDIAEELNVDEVVVSDALADAVSVEIVPNFKLLGPRLGSISKHVRRALAGLDPAAAQAAAATLAGGGSLHLAVEGDIVELGPNDVEVRTTPREGFTTAIQGGLAVALDLELDNGLLHRGLVREVIRQLQDLRKESGLELSDRVVLWLEGLDELREDSAVIRREVLAVRLEFGPGEGPGHTLAGRDGRDAKAWIQKA